MPGYLLDTNVISETARLRPDPRVVQFVTERDDIWICTVSIQELVFGAEQMARGRKHDAIAKWISDLAAVFNERVLQLDWQAAALAGRFKSLAKDAGLNQVDLDASIAGIAFSNDLVLATRNTNDFLPMRIPLFNPWTDEHR
jgi:predicted nucleic acid-binding protein